MEGQRKYFVTLGLFLNFLGLPLVASYAQRAASLLKQTAARVPAFSSVPQRFYSGVSKNKELAPTVAHLRSLDERLSDASLLSRMRTGRVREDDHAKQTYETIGAYKSNEKLKSIAKSVIRKEMRGLKDSEQYYTYYHAHQWPIDLAQRIYAELYPSKNKEFFPLYFLTLLQPPISRDDEQLLVKILQEDGGVREAGNEDYLLSVNTAFFGNLGEYDSSTACFLAENFSISPPKMSAKNMFKYFGHPELHSNYASEWKKVEALHKKASSHGKLWIIKIPKRIHSQIVIPAEPFGLKTKFVIDGKKTDDVDLIQETLRTRPNAIKDIDRMQFRILMTPSTGLNPHLGIKTIPINCADPEKYAAFEKAFYSLMAKIKADSAKKAALYDDMSPAVEDID